MPKRTVETKHYQITQRLRRELMILPPGNEVPTLVELTKHMDVSRTTVQSALNRLQRDGLIHRPAGRKRLVVSERHHGAVRSVTIIRPDFPSADWDVVVRACVMAGKSRRWVFHSHGYSHMENLDLEHALGDCDAAVLLPGAEPFPDHLVKALRRPSRPVVVLAQDSGQPEASHVFMNDRRIGEMATRHLLGLGHRRIGILLDQPPTTTTLGRMEGWRIAMQRAGIADLFPLILDVGVQPYQDPLKACHRFLEREYGERVPDLTAIFTTSSAGAISTLSWLRQRRLRVPGDISVLAYCGEAGIASFLAPSLSGIEIDINEFGNAVADLLDDYLEDPRCPARQIELHPFLVERESVAEPTCASQEIY